MHNQPCVLVGHIALRTTTRKKLLKSGEIRRFYGTASKDNLMCRVPLENSA